eukprot:5175966-Prymnesium_polylepis.1
MAVCAGVTTACARLGRCCSSALRAPTSPPPSPSSRARRTAACRSKAGRRWTRLLRALARRRRPRATAARARRRARARAARAATATWCSCGRSSHRRPPSRRTSRWGSRAPSTPHPPGGKSPDGERRQNARACCE